MSSNVVSTLPFLEDPSSITYMRTSKLMVFVSAAQETVLLEISQIYGKSASCIKEKDESQRLAKVKEACARDQHVIAVVGDLQASILPNLSVYTEQALDSNYMVAIIEGEQENILPQYVGWHLNEADSCMLGLCAHTLLEDLLKSFPDFCSDFRNFTEAETISDMLKYYELAPSNHNGMLHCTAKYFGNSPSLSVKEYFHGVKQNFTKAFETSVIGIVITPRTFGARVKLSSEQLKLWGGDDENTRGKNQTSVDKLNSVGGKSDVAESVSAVCDAMASSSIQDRKEESVNGSSENVSPSPVKKKSPRYFPNCEASLLYSTSDATEDPDFHPVTGPGSKAHMTLGVASGVSAVTTGYDLLEVVELEKQSEQWPTYEGSRGWLRNYGGGRWVLYMKSRITVSSLFSGVYWSS